MDDKAKSVRLTPELQAAYQQTYNDPAKRGTADWYVATKGLVAAGVIQAAPGHEAELDATLKVADSNTDQQSL